MIKNKLRKIEIFKALTDAEIEKIVAISVVKKLSRENILFYEGGVPKYFYALLQGYVKFYKTDLKGHEIVLHFFTKPVMMAEMPSLENISFRATAIAMRDETEVLLIDRERFIELLHKDNEFSFYIIKSLTQKIRELEVAINRNLIYDAITKVCSFIIENPTDLESRKHVEIALVLNMAQETLSRVLRKLKKLNVLDKQCKLLDKKRLNMFLEF
jgi:CRP/FNR family transcriptional regulator